MLYLSGGTVRTGDDSEARNMRLFLEDLGVPASAIIEEGGSVNTAENAQRIASLLKAANVDSIMLVTSALHMPRARNLFAKAGLNVIPAPTDFEVIDMPLDILRVLPDAGALEGSAKAFKELLGYLLA